METIRNKKKKNQKTVGREIQTSEGSSLSFRGEKEIRRCEKRNPGKERVGKVRREEREAKGNGFLGNSHGGFK